MTPPFVRNFTALAVLAVVGACGTESPESPTGLRSGVAADGVADGPPRFSDWSAPVNIGSPVNTASGEFNPVVSRDGLSLYLTCGTSAAGARCPGFGGLGGSDIWVSRRANTDAPWGPPENLGPTINTAFNDHVPTLSPDGHSLYFASDRPGLGANDIYVSRRRNRRDDLGWELPVALPGGVNTAANEIPSSISYHEEHGTQTLYIASNRPGGLGDDDIYAVAIGSDGTSGPAVPVDELNTPFRDTGPFIRRDGLEMFIASNRPGTAGPLDIWVSTRASTLHAWSTPVNLGAVVNSAVIDGRPALSFTGTELYFQSTRPGGAGAFDVWVTRRSGLRGPE